MRGYRLQCKATAATVFAADSEPTFAAGAAVLAARPFRRPVQRPVQRPEVSLFCASSACLGHHAALQFHCILASTKFDAAGRRKCSLARVDRHLVVVHNRSTVGKLLARTMQITAT